MVPTKTSDNVKTKSKEVVVVSSKNSNDGSTPSTTSEHVQILDVKRMIELKSGKVNRIGNKGECTQAVSMDIGIQQTHFMFGLMQTFRVSSKHLLTQMNARIAIFNFKV